MRRIFVLILAMIGMEANAQTPTPVKGDYNYTGNVFFKKKLYLPSTGTTDPFDRDGAIRYNASIGNVELWKAGTWGLLPFPIINLYNTSGRLTGDRRVSGYVSTTSRNSIVFDTLSNFEVHAYGGFGAYNPIYHGMRIIMNSSAGVMEFGWQSEAGRGAVSVAPGSAGLSAQQGSTDNRLSLGLDGNKLLLNNPTTSGTNQLFQVDRVGGIVTLYGYPNTTGKFLTTNAGGTLVLADLPSPENFWTLSGSDIYSNNSGNVGIGSTTPTALLDVFASTGYNQLRLRTSYTPSSSADANGNTGDISWDDNYLYIKTAAGWKRTTLTTF